MSECTLCMTPLRQLADMSRVDCLRCRAVLRRSLAELERYLKEKVCTCDDTPHGCDCADMVDGMRARADFIRQKLGETP